MWYSLMKMFRLWYSFAVVFFLIEGGVCRFFMGELKNACGDTDKCADADLTEFLASVGMMPTTEWELNTYCPAANEVMWCTMDRCTRKNIFGLSLISNHTAEVMHSLFNAGRIVSEICTPGTDLRHSLLAGMSCFKDVLGDGETNVGCQYAGKQKYDNYMKSFDHLVQKTPEEIESEKSCVSIAYSLPCIGDATKQKCGEDAGNMIMSILERVEVLKWLDCSDSEIRFLQTKFLAFLKIEEETKDTYASFFHSHRLA